jgi:hypothetical protein
LSNRGGAVPKIIDIHFEATTYVVFGKLAFPEWNGQKSRSASGR